MNRVLIAEDHPLFASALRQTLEPEHQVVGVVEDGLVVPAAVEQLRARLVLLDLSLPNLSGVRLVRAIRDKAPMSKILIVNGTGSKTLVDACFEGGADGFVDKTLRPDELVTAVRAVLAGKRPVIRDRALSRAAERGAARHPALSELSPRLCQVLKLIGRGCSTEQIARLLGITKRTANAHRCALRARLGVKTQADLYRIALPYAETDD